ncbi:MAG TPA: cytochrome c peroxidase [Ramlibacter sp.]
MPHVLKAVAAAVLFAAAAVPAGANPAATRVPAPTASDREWRLAEPPVPRENAGTPARVELGKVLFFDPRLSDNGAMSCASCHEPQLGWADGRKTSIVGSVVLGRASPTIVNLAYNTQFTWDGRKKDLEEHAVGPHRHLSTAGYQAAATRLGALAGYQALFAKAYPGEPVNVDTIAKALAVFQRSVISNDAPFDRWLAGDTQALTPEQYRGFKVFSDPAKGNCAACHTGGNFTDNGFHNVGLKTADPGRFNIRKVAAMKGAFKTPTLRDIELTAPYFHNGAAETLRDVVEYYARGGEDRSNVSPDIKQLNLSAQEKDELVAFLRALTGRQTPVLRPVLPE